MDLNGKVALVTGGSGDIGGAIAKILASAGADVGVTYVESADRASSTIDAVHACRAESVTGQVIGIDGGMPGGMG